MQEFKKNIDSQIELNKQKNLLYDNLEELFQINSAFIERLNQTKKSHKVADFDKKLEEMIDYTVNKLYEEIVRINQYVQISNSKLAQVKDIYRNTWQKIKTTDDIESVLYTQHYPRLSKWLAEIYPSQLSNSLRHQKTINTISCEEYSPEFQIKMLQLNIQEIMPPVLDIGCGKNGNLVNYLRRLEIDIHGFDRLVETENDYISKDDWLTFDFGKKRWGTIISNAAFSNHITYAANYAQELFEQYRTIYLKIIDSLKNGGTFVYAPGIPLIEDGIDRNDVLLQKQSINFGFYLTTIKRMAVE